MLKKQQLTKQESTDKRGNNVAETDICEEMDKKSAIDNKIQKFLQRCGKPPTKKRGISLQEIEAVVRVGRL